MIMMPCNNCRRSNQCEPQAQMRARLKGAGLTVARFACPTMNADYLPGQRVSVSLRCYTHDNESGDDAEFLGTVMKWRGRKLLIHLDTGRSADNYQSLKAIVKVWPRRVKPIDCPIAPTCDVCSLPSGAVVNDWVCGCQPAKLEAL